MTLRYKVTLAYDGTNFSGFQSQPFRRTVQSTLEKAVNKVSKLDDYIQIFGSGRTDAGVHALGQVVHFDFPHNINEKSMLKALNSLLPLDCIVKKCEIVSKNFHARYSVHKKEYIYIVNQDSFVNPFKRNYTGHYKYPLNLDAIRLALLDLNGEHDFSNLTVSGCQTKNHIRTIYKTGLYQNKEQNELIISFLGNGFLYKQVRIMVAILLEIGRNKRPTHDFLRLYKEKTDGENIMTAPASGLYLKKVYYDN